MYNLTDYLLAGTMVVLGTILLAIVLFLFMCLTIKQAIILINLVALFILLVAGLGWLTLSIFGE